jgi:Derlin-2/3
MPPLPLKREATLISPVSHPYHLLPFPISIPQVWYMEMPVVSRVYLTASVMTTAACALDLVSPFNLYFNLSLVRQGQVWRLFTNFMYFGSFSLDFLFHMYFLVRYCRLLEEGTFRGRTADFIFMILFGATMITCIAPFIRPSIPFLGSSLTFMMVYVWGRRNEHVRLTFLNLFPFTAPYLPWVLLTFSMVLGNPATIDIIGIIVGHTFYFLEFVFPVVAEARGWPIRRLLHTPAVLHYLCGTYHHEEAVRVDFAPAHANAAAPPPPPPPAAAAEGQHPHED